MTLDRETLAAYEEGAGTYARRSTPPDAARAAALVAAAVPGPIVDLGCGAGSHLGLVGAGAVGLDPSAAMLAEARRAHPDTPLLRAAAGALPFARGGLGGAWAHKSLQHVPHADLPMVLADLHRALAVGAPLGLVAFAGEGTRTSDDDLPGRRFHLWDPSALRDVVEGAGFAVTATSPPPDGRAPEPWARLAIDATRARTLPDTVGAGMRLLVCGLNPSLHAADAGVGYAGPGNRFWPALAEAGLAPDSARRDPTRLLREARIGMTDLVKRATPRASELTTAEHRAGVARVERLCRWLGPRAVVLVGLAGWRAAVDRRALPGWQGRRLGPSPVYLMPSTSGLNAASRLPHLVSHLRAAAAGPGPGGGDPA